MMQRGEVIVRFESVSFDWGIKKPILDTVDFSVRRRTKITFMGQNGAGKSTIFALMRGEHEPADGIIHIAKDLSIASARQVMAREDLALTVREFFQSVWAQTVYDIDPKIEAVLEVVNLPVHDTAELPFLERTIGTFSGGQQARLLLAQALIQDPDLLLLDEPTNNLDTAGIAHLTAFLKAYRKTVIVISHDAEFLNSFTDGVLYLDVNTHKVEQYVGNYYDVVKEISARIEKENRKNALLSKEIQANKDKANFFANKGGQMRMVAKRMREKAEELEESKVDVRKEDKAIRPFRIPVAEGLSGEVLNIGALSMMRGGKIVNKKVNVSLRKGDHLLLKGPNGIGKTTLLQSLADGSAKGVTMTPGVRVGYYRQDFSNLDFDKTVYEELASVVERPMEEDIRRVAAGFMAGGELFHAKIGMLSEGQKGLVAFARLVLMRPGLLILDEPTNHINFRHLPVIAEALSNYEGPMILVSHVPEFVAAIRIDEVLDLAK